MKVYIVCRVDENNKREFLDIFSDLESAKHSQDTDWEMFGTHNGEVIGWYGDDFVIDIYEFNEAYT